METSTNLKSRTDTTTTYQVELHGLQPNVVHDDVKARLSQLFKASAQQIETLLAQPGHVIKKNVPAATAAQYKAAIEAAGGVCVLVPEPVIPVTLAIDLPTHQPVTTAIGTGSEAEATLFQGDASLLKSALKIVQGSALGTTQRFVFRAHGIADIVLLRADIQSAEEAKHGFTTKWVVTAKNGERYQFLADNVNGLRRTMLTLTGQQAPDTDVIAEPALGAVKNGTAWLAAFGPTLSGVILVILAAVMNWNIENPTGGDLFKLWLFKLAFIYVFLRADYASVQRQGFNPVALGLVPPENPLYLFRRARAFGHGKGYAITWSVLFGIEILFLIFS